MVKEKANRWTVPNLCSIAAGIGGTYGAVYEFSLDHGTVHTAIGVALLLLTAWGVWMQARIGSGRVPRHKAARSDRYSKA